MFEDIFDFGDLTGSPFGINEEMIEAFGNYLKEKEAKRIAKAKAEWEAKRKTFKWTLEPLKKDNDFCEKYQNGDSKNFYVLKNNEYNIEHYLFCVNGNINEKEEELNSHRFVVLNRCFEDRYSDEVMESCHGKNWKVKDNKTGKPVTPYHMSSYSVIFDTLQGAIIYETVQNEYRRAYIYFYDNIAEIIQEGHQTVYFDLPNKKILAEGKYDKIESNDYIILGKSHYYTREKIERAIMINKHDCEITTLY